MIEYRFLKKIFLKRHIYFLKSKGFDKTALLSKQNYKCIIKFYCVSLTFINGFGQNPNHWLLKIPF